MAEKINWSYAMQIVGGPLVAAGAALDVEAYDKITVGIDDNTTKQVDLAPGAPGAIRLVVINPVKASDKLTYSANGKDIALDAPHVLIGAGAVTLLGAAATSLALTNKTGAVATVEILVARDATP